MYMYLHSEIHAHILTCISSDIFMTDNASTTIGGGEMREEKVESSSEDGLGIIDLYHIST